MTALGTANAMPRVGLDVLNWRYQELERAGYPVEVAVMLAERGDVDLHLAVDLLAGGASVDQVLRIVT